MSCWHGLARDLQCHAAPDCSRRASGRDRGVVGDRRPPPAGQWPNPKRGWSWPHSSVLPLRGGVEPSEVVPGGTSAALPVVSCREPRRHGLVAAAHRRHDRRDRTSPPRAPRSPLPEVPRDVAPPTGRHLHGGRSRRAPRLSRLPATVHGASGVVSARLTCASTAPSPSRSDTPSRASLLRQHSPDRFEWKAPCRSRG